MYSKRINPKLSRLWKQLGPHLPGTVARGDKVLRIIDDSFVVAIYFQPSGYEKEGRYPTFYCDHLFSCSDSSNIGFGGRLSYDREDRLPLLADPIDSNLLSWIIENCVYFFNKYDNAQQIYKFYNDFVEPAVPVSYRSLRDFYAHQARFFTAVWLGDISPLPLYMSEYEEYLQEFPSSLPFEIEIELRMRNVYWLYNEFGLQRAKQELNKYRLQTIELQRLKNIDPIIGEGPVRQFKPT